MINHPAKITLVHQAALGDTILLIPLLRSLRLRFPDCHITLVTRTNLGQALTMLRFADAYFSADDLAHTRWFSPPNPPSAPSPTPAPPPPWPPSDLLLSAVSNGGDPWAQNARNHTPKVLFFNPRPPPDYPHHVTQYHRDQLPELELQIPDPPLLKSNPDGPILIHPGSGGEAKCWPREKYLSLGRTLICNGIIPTFLLGEVEQARWDFHLMKQLQTEFNWFLHLGIYELAIKLSRARLYLGNDSGVSHLAAAMGIPTLTLFGPSNDITWSPVGPYVKIIRPPAPTQTDLATLPESQVLAELLTELRKLN